MIDLFGEKHPEPDRYTTYLASAQWARKREQKLAEAGYRCERCGNSKWTRPLDVHHLTYDRLGHERMEDLEVLCKDCHQTADYERMADEQTRKANSALYSGFQNWLERGHKHLDKMSDSAAWRAKREFLCYMRRVTGKSYSMDLTLLGKKDPDPKWKP